MINIRSHQENANQNYTESLNHACQNGNHQENEQQQILTRIQGKWNPYSHWCDCTLVQLLWNSV
jgi:hypothetical protein